MPAETAWRVERFRAEDGAMGFPPTSSTSRIARAVAFAALPPLPFLFKVYDPARMAGRLMGQRRCDFAPEEFGPFMEWEHAREMQRHGIDFGSHSVTHRKLALLPAQQVEEEMQRSKSTIEQALSRPLDGFCYPFGSYDAFTRATEACGLRHGYRYLATTVAGHNVEAADVTRLKRLRVSWVDSAPREIQKQCAGSYNWYRFYQWMHWRIRRASVPQGEAGLLA